jgi:hypothetical protein
VASPIPRLTNIVEAIERIRNKAAEMTGHYA